MKIKALVLSAALAAVMVGHVQAQVYSANAVGYVNKSLPVGFSIWANPLNGSPDNSLDNTLPLGPTDAVTIFRFDTASQGFGGAISWFGSFWFASSGDPNDLILAPGEAFFILNQGVAPVDVTWVGEVPQGSLSNPIPGNGDLSLRSSQVPQEAALGSPVLGGLEFPVSDTVGATVYIFDNASGGYLDAYSYFGDAFGWFSTNPGNDPNGPNIPVGEGFFVQYQGVGAGDWTREFSVNE